VPGTMPSGTSSSRSPSSLATSEPGWRREVVDAWNLYLAQTRRAKRVDYDEIEEREWQRLKNALDRIAVS
jgi:hypothetical protein